MQDYPLSKAKLRQDKRSRDAFRAQPRRPIRVLLDNVRQPYNVGALLRLCDGLLIERLIICGGVFDLGRRKVVQAAQGAQNWVPWEWQADALEAVASARQEGCSILVVEQTAASIPVGQLRVAGTAPLCVVLGAERTGVSPAIVAIADRAVMIPMRGMCNSLNVVTAAAIVLHALVQDYERQGR